jgi:hypothetical protein
MQIDQAPQARARAPSSSAAASPSPMEVDVRNRSPRPPTRRPTTPVPPALSHFRQTPLYSGMVAWVREQCDGLPGDAPLPHVDAFFGGHPRLCQQHQKAEGLSQLPRPVIAALSAHMRDRGHPSSPSYDSLGEPGPLALAAAPIDEPPAALAQRPGSRKSARLAQPASMPVSPQSWQGIEQACTAASRPRSRSPGPRLA